MFGYFQLGVGLGIFHSLKMNYFRKISSKIKTQCFIWIINKLKKNNWNDYFIIWYVSNIR